MDIKDQYIRNFLRILAAIVLTFEAVLIMKTKLDTGAFYLDQNDGWVIFGCICLLLAIEGVRAYVKKKLGGK